MSSFPLIPGKTQMHGAEKNPEASGGERQSKQDSGATDDHQGSVASPGQGDGPEELQ